MIKECCRFKLGKCRSAKNPQPLANFAKDAKRKDGLTVHCKSCLKAYREENKVQRTETIKRWRARNRDKMKEYQKRDAPNAVIRTRIWREKNLLQRRYRIDRAEWNRLFESQNGCCAICGTAHDELKRGLCVDHDHIFGNVRGLLCHPCNQAIGLLQDCPSRVNAVLQYLS